MGNLITELPVSEMNATIELFDRLGVDREGLKRFRKASSHEQMTIAAMIQNGIIPAEQKFVPALSKKPINHVLDLATIPSPSFHKDLVVEHRGVGVVCLEHRNGDFCIGNNKVELHISPKQKKGMVSGHDLRKYHDGKPSINATVLDYLLVHQELIPDAWKADESGNTPDICFFGTIYRDVQGNLYVRCLYWGGGLFMSRYRWLNSEWGVSPSALLAS